MKAFEKAFEGVDFDEQPAPVEEPHEQQEPVAWTSWRELAGARHYGTTGWVMRAHKLSDEDIPLYTSPQSKPWVWLTDEEVKPLCDENHIIFGAYTVDFIQAVEAKLREKNAQPSKPLPFNKDDMEGLDINQRLAFKLGWRSAEQAHGIKGAHD